MGNLIFIFIFLFSFKSYGLVHPCEGIFETGSIVFDIKKKTPGQLTAKNKQVLFRLVMGDSREEIAKKFNIGVSSVDAHITTMFRLYKLNKATSLVSFAIYNSIIDLDLVFKTNGYTKSFFGGRVNDMDLSIPREVFGAGSPFRSEGAPLNYKERVVLFYLILGYSHQEIAYEIGYSTGYVWDQQAKIMKNMNVKSMTAACVKAVWFKMFGDDLVKEMFRSPPSKIKVDQIVRNSLKIK